MTRPLDPRLALALLQHGDSAFPSGGFAFSNGLEGVLEEQPELGRDLTALLRRWLVWRWAPFDQVFVARAATAAGGGRLAELDAELDAMLLSEGERDGSRRGGAALLSTHRRLGTPLAEELADAVRAGRVHGHRLVVEGALWAAVGLGVPAVRLLSGYSFLSATSSAAVRLGACGAIGQQQTLADLRDLLADLVAVPVAELPPPATFNPWAEIAVMRAPARHSALFTT